MNLKSIKCLNSALYCDTIYLRRSRYDSTGKVSENCSFYGSTVRFLYHVGTVVLMVTALEEGHEPQCHGLESHLGHGSL